MTTLDRADYWQLRALTGDLEREQLAAALAQARLELARLRRQDYWRALAARYELPIDRPYGLMDESCALVDTTTAAVSGT